MNQSPEAEIANLEQDLELAYISIDTQKTYIANVDIENKELSKRNADLLHKNQAWALHSAAQQKKNEENLQRISELEKRLKSYQDDQNKRYREELEELRSLQEDGYCRGIGGGHGY